MIGVYLGTVTREGHDLIYLAGTQEGNFFWFIHPDGTRYFCSHYPGESHIRSIPVVQGDARGKMWGWDGNEEMPTLTPSIHARDSNLETVWHGFVEKGVFRSC